MVNDFLFNENVEKFNSNLNKNSDKLSFTNKQEKIERNEVITKRRFVVGESVFYRHHFKNWIKWIPAIVKQQISPVTYLIEVNGTIRFVQENQIRYPSERDQHSKVIVSSEASNTNNTPNTPDMYTLEDSFNEIIEISSEEVLTSSSSNESTNDSSICIDTPIVPGTKRKRRPENLRRSKRRNKKFKRFGDNIYDKHK